MLADTAMLRRAKLASPDRRAPKALNWSFAWSAILAIP